jgi:hypothetical protein
MTPLCAATTAPSSAYQQMALFFDDVNQLSISTQDARAFSLDHRDAIPNDKKNPDLV